MVLHALGNTQKRRDVALGRSSLLESEALFRTAGDQHGAGMAIYSLGHMARSADDLAQAEQYYQRAHELLRGDQAYESGIGARLDAVADCFHLYLCLSEAGALETARPVLVECLELARDAGYRHVGAHALVATAALICTDHPAQRTPERMLRAVRYLAHASTVPDAARCGDHPDAATHEATLREALDPRAFAAAWEEGLAMPFEQIVARALDDVR